MAEGAKVIQEPVALWSEGSRLGAELYLPEDIDEPAPAIMLCHGWGGERPMLGPYARAFAQRGYIVLEIDYRGWGTSDGKIIPLADTPPLLEAGIQTLDIRVVRKVTDPLDQITDIRNGLGFLFSDPRVDPKRVGIWGTSYGGGHSIYVAANEPRVRCVVGQIGSYEPAPEFRAMCQQRLGDKARGLIDPPVPQGIDALPGLLGTPDLARMLGYSPLQASERIRAPTLIIDAEFEELFDRIANGKAVFDTISQNAVALYHTFPGKHYDVYNQFWADAVALACDWFDEHLQAGIWEGK